MYNSSSSPASSSSEHMNPRISFSNDFAESHHFHHHHQQQVMRNQPSSSSAAAASDFEFSVVSGNNKSYSNMSSTMTTADELFSKGQLLPFKPNSKTTTTTTTLRDELLVDDEQVSLRPPKTSITRWKGFLGLKTKKSPAHKPNNTSQQEMFSDGSGSSCRDVEIGR